MKQYIVISRHIFKDGTFYQSIPVKTIITSYEQLNALIWFNLNSGLKVVYFEKVANSTQCVALVNSSVVN